MNYDKSYLPFVETTTPAPMPRQPSLLPLSDLIRHGSPQGSLCLQTSPAQDHRTPFRHKALPLSSTSGAGSNSRAPTRLQRLRGLWRPNPQPLPNNQPRPSQPEQRVPSSQGRWQGCRMNKPVCACIGVSACAVREISAFSRAKFQAQNPAGQP
jgi:hypothetical protein